MQRRKELITTLMIAGILALGSAGAASAQALWKYTDKDGKVTYSDKAPKKGETAQLVTSDPSANVIDSPKNTREGVPQKSPESNVRNNERESQRTQLREALDAAKGQLDTAKAALEAGREPTPEEVQIVVGRSATGGTTGVNSIIRKQEYYARIASLEDAVKKAESNVETAERNYQRSAP